MNEVVEVDQKKQIEQLVLTCIDTAKGMLKEYEAIIPFGIRTFNDSEDMKMNCPGDKNPEINITIQVENVVSELKDFVSKENIYAVGIVTELEADDDKGIGLQVETAESAVLFVYPFKKVAEEWLIEEPVQTSQLLKTVF